MPARMVEKSARAVNPGFDAQDDAPRHGVEPNLAVRRSMASSGDYSFPPGLLS
jgi:hypothetical protein